MLTSDGIFVLIDQVFGDVLDDEFVCFVGHPCMNEGREVQGRVSVEGEFVMNQLVNVLCVSPLVYLY